MRSFTSDIPTSFLLEMQDSLFDYSWRGTPMVKSPFDLALYSLLLHKVQPRVIFEIGSYKGGSALWFADMLEAMEIDGQVLSYDTMPMQRPEHERVTFRYADGRHLGRHIRPELLNAAPHPWLVVEDADHEFETSMAVLEFFEPHMQTGDWFVIEDSNLTQMYPEHGTSGPHRALGVFLSHHPEYRVATEYADFFARNATTAINGWLEKRTDA